MSHTATMDDELFRALRDDIGLSDGAAANMASVISRRDAVIKAEIAALRAAIENDQESARIDHEAERVADRDAFAAKGEAAPAPAAFATEREARIYRMLYDDTSFGEFLRNAAATFKVSGAEIKKMVTGKPWNGWVLYQSVMISLLMVAMPALFVLMIYLWVAL